MMKAEGRFQQNRWKSNGNSWLLWRRSKRNASVRSDHPPFCSPWFRFAGRGSGTGFFGVKELKNLGARITSFWHNPRLQMTKTELQSALAEATQTDKRIAGVFLDTLNALAYKEIKKNGEFVLPGFGKLVKQKRKARIGINPKTQQKIKIPAKTVVKLRVPKAAKDGVLGVKK